MKSTKFFFILAFGAVLATTIFSCKESITDLQPTTQDANSTAYSSVHADSLSTDLEEVNFLPQSVEDRACSSVSDPCSNSTNNANCVKYVRCKLPSLPYGLTTYAQKVAIINTQVAAAGRAAIIYVPGSTYGHLAYVKSVSGSNITIRETNWCGLYVNERTGTKTALKITGFWKP